MLFGRGPRAWLRLAILGGLVAPSSACRDAVVRLAASPPAESLGRAEQMFAALGARVTEPLRDQKYDSARVRIVSAAFIPSRVWDDTSVWTSSTSSRRTLLVGGRFLNGRYVLDAARSVPAPEEPAESRHVINLTRLSDDEFAWDTEVPYAIGSITAREVGAFTSALFAGAEGRVERDVRADYRATIGRTSAVLGQLFRLDSIKTTRLPDSSTVAAFAVTMTPVGVEAKYPNFARYMRRYVQTTRMRWSLTDRAGASYFDLMIADGRLTLRVRTLKGNMVPLTGSASQMPDSLTLSGNLTMKVSRFTVGFHDYHADFIVVRNDRERAWSIVSRREPEWTLPFVTEHLLRTPLRRPFQGRGALFRIGVRDSAGAQTILDRRLHLEVRESMILRFIGRLGAIAVSDYQGLAEREQLAWLREVFDALVADLRALSP